ncbi:MAG: preprotein translocase subunit SecG [Candidatus Latescibacterota bacterium]
MHAILIFLHLVVSLGLILVVLLQSSKGGGLAGALGGGGGMGAVFGGRGAGGFLTKLTTGLAIAFMLSCLLHSAISPTASSDERSALQEELNKKAMEKAPASVLPGSPASQMEETDPSEETETE